MAASGELKGDAAGTPVWKVRLASALRWLLPASLVVLVLATFRDYGYSWDETWQNRWYGQAVLRFIASLGQDRSATHTHNFYLYGGSFDAAAELLVALSPLEPRNARHLANAVAGLAGAAGCWAIARRLGGRAAGAWGAAFLLACAPWYGHMFMNAKDIPFAAGYAWSLYWTLRLVEQLPCPSLKTSLVLGIVLGLTLGVRVGGVLLLGYLGLIALAWLLHGRLREGWGWSLVMNRAGRLAAAGLVIVASAWPLMVAAWPAALLHPLAIPLEALRASSRFPWVGQLLWNGREVWSNHLPWSYLPVVYGVQVPEVVALLFVGTIAWGGWQCVQRGPAAPSTAILLLSVLFPVVWAVAAGSTIYDNGRHFLFVLPPLAALAGIAWVRLLAAARDRLRRLSVVLSAAMLAALASAGARMASLHPYEYTYLNAFAGGMPEGARRFDTDYWITSYREASTAMLRHAAGAAEAVGRPFASIPFSVAVVGPPESLLEFLPPNFTVLPMRPDVRADYLIATTRWNSDAAWPDWQEVATVGRADMRFAVVKASPDLARAGALGR